MNKNQKLSISVPEHLYLFIQEYQDAECISSRSEVFVEALKALQEKYLEQCYAEAAQQYDEDWENTNMDGLENETW